MKHWQVLVATLLGVLALAGCRQIDDVTVNGHSIILHPPGAPSATITSRGSFSVNDQEVTLSPDQRALLIKYFNGVVAVHRDRDKLKDAGMAMAKQAVHAAGDALGGALAHAGTTVHATNAAGEPMDAQGNQVGQMAEALCRKVHQVLVTQNALATQLGAFKPYASIDPAAQVHCGS